ncbi:MAG: hypothetical protein ACOCRO_01545 [Halanaerobiales bacterium]
MNFIAAKKEYTIVVKGYISERLVSRLSEINEKSFKDGNINIKVSKGSGCLFLYLKKSGILV